MGFFQRVILEIGIFQWVILGIGIIVIVFLYVIAHRVKQVMSHLEHIRGHTRGCYHHLREVADWTLTGARERKEETK